MVKKTNKTPEAENKEAAASEKNLDKLIEYSGSHIGFLLILRDKDNDAMRASEDLISMPMIFDEEQLQEEDFSFEDYIDLDRYELVFVQSYTILKHQLMAIRRLAKQNNIELD